MKPQQIESHLTILGWLFIVSHALVLGLGALGFFLLAGIGVFAAVDSQELVPLGILSIIGTTALAFFFLLALPGLLAGYGLLRRKSWARILALVVGFLSLFNFPVGTALGAYTFWVLLQDEAEEYFMAPKPA